jgi:hypothetical protein
MNTAFTKRAVMALVFIAFLTGCQGCASPMTVPLEGAVKELGLLNLQRLETYVVADQTLTTERREELVAGISAARLVFTSGQEEVHYSNLQRVEPLLAIYRAYVMADPTLDELRRSVYTGNVDRFTELLESIAKRFREN